MHRRSVRLGESRAWRRAVVRTWGRAASGRRPIFFEPRVARPLSAHRWRDPFWAAELGNYLAFSQRAASLLKLVFAKYLHGLVFWLCRSFLRFMGRIGRERGFWTLVLPGKRKKVAKRPRNMASVSPRSLRDVSDALAWVFRPGALRSIGARPFSCFLLSKRSASPIRTSGPRERSLRRVCARHLPP